MVGTPFHWHGRLPGVGIDCSGLIIKAAEMCGINFSFKGKYSRANQAQVIDAALREHCDPVITIELLMAQCTGDAASWLKPGDIFFLDITAGPGHLMIYTGETVIHASDKPCFMQVIEQPFTEPDDLDMISAVYRLRGSK